MRKNLLRVLGPICLFAYMAECLASSAMPTLAQQSDYVEGKWSDACPCKVACPCWKTKRSSSQLCVNVQVFQVTSDSSSSNKLTGSRFVLLNLPDDSYQAPRADTLFIDVTLPDSKSAQIESLVKNTFGTFKVVRVPIEIMERDSRLNVRVAERLRYEAETDGKAPAQEVIEHLYPWLHNPEQGYTVSADIKYGRDNKESIQYSRSNSIFAKFRMLKPNAEPSLRSTSAPQK